MGARTSSRYFHRDKHRLVALSAQGAACWVAEATKRVSGRSGEPFLPTPCEEPAAPSACRTRRERTEKEDGAHVELSGTHGAFGRQVRRSSPRRDGGAGDCEGRWGTAWGTVSQLEHRAGEVARTDPHRAQGTGRPLPRDPGHLCSCGVASARSHLLQEHVGFSQSLFKKPSHVRRALLCGP